jgi:hypothetical protein
MAIDRGLLVTRVEETMKYPVSPLLSPVGRNHDEVHTALAADFAAMIPGSVLRGIDQENLPF